MTETATIEFEHGDFDFESLEDELAVDARCQTLLQQFYFHQIAQDGSELVASECAYAADHYLRDYVIDFCRHNVVRPQPGLVRYFAASWYITHSIDPDLTVLEKQLAAIAKFYRFLHHRHYISADELMAMEAEASQISYYQQRIESFLAIAGDGFVSWNAAELPPLRA